MTQKMIARECEMLRSILAELQAEAARIKSRQQEDRLGLGGVLTAAEIARLNWLWAAIEVLRSLIAGGGCVCGDDAPGYSLPFPASGPSL